MNLIIDVSLIIIVIALLDIMILILQSVLNVIILGKIKEINNLLLFSKAIPVLKKIIFALHAKLTIIELYKS